MAYIANSEEDRQEMLEAIGVKDFEELIDYIPDSLRVKGGLKLPTKLSEFEIKKEMDKLANRNSIGVSFLGGGAYDHYIPSAIRHMLWRSEFYTAYTPYQAEVSQGTLQSIYEYQTMICRLTGMEVANASMYDGGSALAEAVIMAIHHTKKPQVMIAENINPFYFDIIRTYTKDQNISIVPIGTREGLINHDELRSNINSDTAAVIVQNPNYFGLIEDLNGLSEKIHENNALFIQQVDPISLGILKSPGELGADIVVSEGQVLGNPLNYGGPYLGIFASKKSLIRKMPGRIVAKTTDMDGRQAFVTTLQTREQHIRRENATSNICTNSQLCALAALLYLSLMGSSGIRTVAEQTIQKSHYLAKEIEKINGYKLKYPGSHFKEFVVETPGAPAKIINSLAMKNIFAGIDLSCVKMGKGLLIAVTEKRTRAEMDNLVSELKEFE